MTYPWENWHKRLPKVNLKTLLSPAPTSISFKRFTVCVCGGENMSKGVGWRNVASLIVQYNELFRN